jgi:hypothetical protein
MERTGIEPVTSGLQIQSNAGVGRSWEVATAYQAIHLGGVGRRGSRFVVVI